MLTINELIEQLRDASTASPLGGDTVVYLSEQEREYAPIAKVVLERDDNGAIALINVD